MFHAVVDHHEALLAALRHRVEELGLTLETVENIAGLPVGYASKVLSDPPVKRMNAFTWFPDRCRESARHAARARWARKKDERVSRGVA